MPDPLINRDALAALMDEVDEQIALGNPYVTYADATMSYLRTVLTPEALDPHNFRPSSTQGVYYGERLTGTDLHRRIFGEGE